MDDNNNFTNNDPSMDSHQINPIEQQVQAVDERDGRGHRRKRKKDRFDAIIAENKIKDYQQQKLLEALHEKDIQLAEARAQAQQNAHNSNIYYEKSLEDNEQRILKELELAKEEGDIKKEIEIHRQLADVTSQKHTQILSKALSRQQPQQQPIMENYQVPYPPYPEPNAGYIEEPLNDYNEEEQEWLEENPWANSQSNEFNPNLVNKWKEFSTELNARLRYNKRGDMIGTPEYFSALNNLMFGDNTSEDNGEDNYVEPNAYNAPNNNMKSYAVAPVSKKGSSMADQYLSRNNYNGTHLSPQEVSMATKMIPVYSNIHKRDFTQKEAEDEFKRGRILHEQAEREKRSRMETY